MCNRPALWGCQYVSHQLPIIVVTQRLQLAPLPFHGGLADPSMHSLQSKLILGNQGAFTSRKSGTIQDRLSISLFEVIVARGAVLAPVYELHRHEGPRPARLKQVDASIVPLGRSVTARVTLQMWLLSLLVY